MINFAWPWLLLALPLPLLMYRLPAKTKAGVATLKMPTIIENVGGSATTAKKQHIPLILLSLIWLLFVLAGSRPQWLGDAVNIPTESREMMIAVDLSGSMKAEDMRLNGDLVNRLEMLKVVLGDFIERRVGDRLGLILFGDDAYMQTPMTYDRKTVKQMLDESVIGLVGTQTAIGDAVTLATKRFAEKEVSNRILLLVTDGRNTAGKITPDEALELAVNNNITIYTIGIGAGESAQNTLFRSQAISRIGNIGSASSFRDLDEKLLTEMADKTGGKYFLAESAEDMEEIYLLLDQLEPVEQEQQKMRPVSAMFYWPLSLALLISFGYILWLTLAPKFTKPE